MDINSGLNDGKWLMQGFVSLRSITGTGSYHPGSYLCKDIELAEWGSKNGDRWAYTGSQTALSAVTMHRPATEEPPRCLQNISRKGY